MRTMRAEALTSGRVEPVNIALMADCVADGFRQTVPLLVHIHVDREQRADALRVETAVDSAPLIYADMQVDGTVTLIETSRAKLINTSAQRDALAKCLARYAATS